MDGLFRIICRKTKTATLRTKASMLTLVHQQLTGLQPPPLFCAHKSVYYHLSSLLCPAVLGWVSTPYYILYRVNECHATHSSLRHKDGRLIHHANLHHKALIFQSA